MNQPILTACSITGVDLQQVMWMARVLSEYYSARSKEMGGQVENRLKPAHLQMQYNSVGNPYIR
jgi:hypothetical protein